MVCQAGLQFAKLCNLFEKSNETILGGSRQACRVCKFGESFALTSKGSSFQGILFGGESETRNKLIETHADSDWSNRSPSVAVHVLNGIGIWYTSRTQTLQTCIILRCTESEWYAATWQFVTLSSFVIL